MREGLTHLLAASRSIAADGKHLSVSMSSSEPVSSTTGPILMVVSEDPEHSAWLNAGECERAGVAVAWLGGSSSAPDLNEITRQLESVKPDACLLLGDGTLSRLVWVLADLANLPVFVLITDREQLNNLTRRRKPKSDLFLITNPDLLPAALEDDRYGSTMLAIGHPTRDLRPSGPSPVDARQQFLATVQRWWRGEACRQDTGFEYYRTRVSRGG